MKIPDSLTYAFTYWMIEQGFHPQLKKDCYVLRRNNEVVKIFWNRKTEQKHYAMNEIAQKKFKAFCRAWLNRDKTFIENLVMAANFERSKAANKNYLKVA